MAILDPSLRHTVPVSAPITGAVPRIDPPVGTILGGVVRGVPSAPIRGSLPIAHSPLIAALRQPLPQGVGRNLTPGTPRRVARRRRQQVPMFLRALRGL